MFCISCGNEIPDSSAFCTSCGKPVKKSEEPKMQPQAETVTTNAETVTSNTETVAVSTEAVEISDEKALLTEGIVVPKNEAGSIEETVNKIKMNRTKEKKMPKGLFLLVKRFMIPIAIFTGLICLFLTYFNGGGYSHPGFYNFYRNYVFHGHERRLGISTFLITFLFLINLFLVIVAMKYKNRCYICGSKRKGICDKCNINRPLVSIITLIGQWGVIIISLVYLIWGYQLGYGWQWYVVCGVFIFLYVCKFIWNGYMFPAHNAKRKGHPAATVIWWLTLLLTIPTFGVIWIAMLIWSFYPPKTVGQSDKSSANNMPIQERMKQLEELKSSGILTEEEYAKKREELISQL